MFQGMLRSHGDTDPTAMLSERRRGRVGRTGGKRPPRERSIVLMVPILLAIGVAGGCAGEPAEGEGLRGGVITGAGATFIMPLVTLWSYEYEARTGKRVNYNSIGSGGGIRAHIDRTVDFGATEAPLNPEQFRRAEGTLTLPLTIGTVALAYNLPGVDELRLTGSLLADIYLERVTRWDDPRIQELNPDQNLPDRRIVTVHRSDGAGTTFIFSDYLSKVSEAWAEVVGVGTSLSWPGGIGGNGNEGVAGAVRNNPYSIGYIEFSYAMSLNMPTAYMENQEGLFLQPSLEGATAAAAAVVEELPAGHESWHEVSFTNAPGVDSYPLSSFSYYIVYEDLARAGRNMTRRRAVDMVEWLEWTVTEGQRYNNDVGNAAIPDRVRELNLESLDRVHFEGEPVRSR